MSIFSDVYKRIVDDRYIQALRDDGISVQDDIIEKAKQGNKEAIHKIGCIYASNKNKEKAMKWLCTSSAMGVGESQLEIGCLHMDLSSDYETAIEWFRLAAIHNIKSAYAHEGEVHFNKGDYEIAYGLFKKSADLGDAYGENRLGEFCLGSYLNKLRSQWIVQQDYNSAMTLFRKAADQNFSRAQFNISCLYENGNGVQMDHYEALQWYLKSEAGGYKPATEGISRVGNLGFFYIPTKEEIKEDQSLPTYKEATELSKVNDELELLKIENTE